MYLTGLTHRDELFDLTARSLNDDFREGDGRIITEIFLYEGLISGSFVINRMVRFLQNVFGKNLEMERIRQKHILRERLLQYIEQPTGRTEELVQTFRDNPEFFFPRLVRGGYIFVHDYNSKKYAGVKAAVREFCMKNNIAFFPLSDRTGSVIISK